MIVSLNKLKIPSRHLRKFATKVTTKTLDVISRTILANARNSTVPLKAFLSVDHQVDRVTPGGGERRV